MLVAHARVVVIALHFFEFVKHAVELRAACGDALVNFIKGLGKPVIHTLRNFHELRVHAFAYFFELIEKCVDTIAQLVGMLTEQVPFAALILHFVPKRAKAGKKFVVISRHRFYLLFEFGQLLLVSIMEFGR